ncbi:hypothetical protein EVAR_50357_1 [Eumeta japonica]|uniref:Uncharacterized protein n=1 Tax=Eumeta variegata TaxID=151549 RepID=A0A4C1Y070_EUMVA|nr:hypothetical protein EVAR_50357_1 [Eumeta japonica]
MELLGSSLLHSMQRCEPLESTNPKVIYDSSYFLFFVFETVELDVVASSPGSKVVRLALQVASILPVKTACVCTGPYAVRADPARS